jgi:GNAT superfamily N-acetyltransferase
MIRPIEATDLADWQRLWNGYQAFYKVEIDPVVTHRTFERLLHPAEPMFAALAMHDSRPVGLVHFLFHRSTWTSGDYCYLQDLFVEPGLRGNGVGRRLIEYVYQEARSAKASRVYWLTHETNEDAMQLYDRIANRSGFLQYRRLLD